MLAANMNPVSELAKHFINFEAFFSSSFVESVSANAEVECDEPEVSDVYSDALHGEVTSHALRSYVDSDAEMFE